jgi:hypothetical protein
MSGLTLNKSRYRIVLEVEAFDDLDPMNIDWNEILDLNPEESVRLLKVEDDDEYMF